MNAGNGGRGGNGAKGAPGAIGVDGKGVCCEDSYNYLYVQLFSYNPGVYHTHGNPHYAVLKAGSAGGNGGKGGDGGKGTPGGAGGPITVVLLSDSKTKRMF